MINWNDQLHLLQTSIVEVVICGRFGHEPMLLGILRGMRKARVQTLDFTRAEFSLFKDLIDGIL